MSNNKLLIDVLLKKLKQDHTTNDQSDIVLYIVYICEVNYQNNHVSASLYSSDIEVLNSLG